MSSEIPRILIVEARFYDDLSDALLKGARAALDTAGAVHHTVTVPGALEVPGAIAFALDRAVPYDGYVALGMVIRGETYHFEIVCNESARGLTDLAVGRGAAIGNGIVTVETMEQGRERADPDRKDKGGDAARATLAMVALKHELSLP